MSFSDNESVPEKAANADDAPLALNDWNLLHASPEKEAFLRDILVRIADKWTLAVVECLDVNGEMRFTRLQESVGGVSQKMLTKTLRQLERDGLVTRNVHATHSAARRLQIDSTWRKFFGVDLRRLHLGR